MEAACGLSSLLLPTQCRSGAMARWGQLWLGTAVVPGIGNIYQGGYFKEASELRR